MEISFTTRDLRTTLREQYRLYSTVPGVRLFDHVDQPQQLLHPDVRLPARELAGQLGQVVLAESVGLLQDTAGDNHIASFFSALRVQKCT